MDQEREKPLGTEQVVLELSGSAARRGLALSTLESFFDEIVRSLRAFDRGERLEPGLKTGHPSKRDELVTAFRVVGLKPGSAIITLEPDTDVVSGELDVPGGSLALSNLEALMDAYRKGEAFDPDAAASLAKARRVLGEDGRIRIIRKSGATRKSHTITIDAPGEKKLQAHARDRKPRPQRISGLLHLIDVDPFRVGIRSSDGTEWMCKYDEELASTVKQLLEKKVWARGMGQLTGGGRGTLTLEGIQPLNVYEQTPLFTFARVPMQDLMSQQSITGPPPSDAFALPDDVTEEQLDHYLASILS